MTKKLLTLLILTLFIFTSLAVVAEAKIRMHDKRVDRIAQYGFQAQRQAATQPESEYGAVTTSKRMPPASLGYSGLTDAPGEFVGTSYRDKQYHVSAPRMIDWRAPDPQIHIAYTYQMCGGDPDVCPRFHAYNLYDPISGTWPLIANIGIALQTVPKQGTYVSLDVEPANGGALVAGIITNDGSFTDFVPAQYGWDATAPIIYGNFQSIPVNMNLAVDTFGVSYPRIEHHIYGTDTAIYLLCYEGVYDDEGIYETSFLEFWKKPGGAASTESWTMTPLAEDEEFWWDSWDISASRVSGKVAVSFVAFLLDTLTNGGSDVFYRVSNDMGNNWGSIQNITGYVSKGNEPGYRAWIESHVLITSDDEIHVLFNANRYFPPHLMPDSAAVYNNSRRCRLFHWSSGTGIISTVQNAEFDPLRCCGVGGINVQNLARFELSECADRLYAVWVQYGDPDNGDSTDCADYDAGYSVFAIGYNGDLHMSVSTDLTGLSWDAARNITNTKTPDCGLDSCHAENMPSISRVGMDVSDWTGLDWSSAPDAFTVNPGTHTNTEYIDVFYVDDHSPSAAPDNAGRGYPETYTSNPHKWFRLPCVDPVIKPIILVHMEDVTYPFYTQHGEYYNLKVPVENAGNDILHVNTIRYSKYTYTTTDWIGLSKTSMTITNLAPNNWDTVVVTLNKGGAINNPGTIVELSGEVFFDSDDPDNPTVSFLVDFPVADTIVGVVWGEVSTGIVSLAVGSNGNMGNNYIGYQNLDYYNTTLECDNASSLDSSGADTIPGDASIYLGDASPVILTAQIVGSDTNVTASWSIFGNGFASENGFKPVIGETPGGVKLTNPTHYTSGGYYDCYHSGTFITVDSTVAVEKTYYAPTGTNAQYVIQMMRIYSYDGAAHSGLVIGEAFDWDIPADTGSYNKSATDPVNDLIYQIGGEFNENHGDSLECTNNDTRMGGAVRIGYYTKAEWNADSSVMHTDPIYGGYAALNEDYVYPASGFVPLELYRNMLTNSGLNAQPSSVIKDQHTVLTYFNNYSLGATDTLIIWTVMATIPPTFTKDVQALVNQIDAAKAWLEDNIWDIKKEFLGCCIGMTGNADCSASEDPDISDITRLISFLYLQGAELCCVAEADVDNSGGSDPQVNDVDISDITYLIAHLYLDHRALKPCP